MKSWAGWTESGRSISSPAGCGGVGNSCAMRVFSRCVRELCGMSSLTGAAELAPGIVQVGLHASQSRRREGSFVETSRVQYHILLIRGIILPRCCSSSVCALSSNHTRWPYLSLQLSCQIHVILRRFPRIQPRRYPIERYHRWASAWSCRSSCGLRISEVRLRPHVDSNISTWLSAQLLLVVQPNERNVFDQRHLEYELLEQCVTLR